MKHDASKFIKSNQKLFSSRARVLCVAATLLRTQYPLHTRNPQYLAIVVLRIVNVLCVIILILNYFSTTDTLAARDLHLSRNAS